MTEKNSSAESDVMRMTLTLLLITLLTASALTATALAENRANILFIHIALHEELRPMEIARG